MWLCFLFLFLLWFLLLFFILLFILFSLFFSFLLFVLFFFLFLFFLLLLLLSLFLFKVVFARSVSHRQGLSITPGGLHKSGRNIIISFNKIESKKCHSFSRMLRFNLLGSCHNIFLWSTEFATNCLAICHHSLALGSSRNQILKKQWKMQNHCFFKFWEFDGKQLLRQAAT